MEFILNSLFELQVTTVLGVRAGRLPLDRQIFKHTVTAGEVKLEVHKVRVHPQFFGDKPKHVLEWAQKFYLKYAIDLTYAILLPHIQAPCTTPG